MNPNPKCKKSIWSNLIPNECNQCKKTITTYEKIVTQNVNGVNKIFHINCFNDVTP